MVKECNSEVPHYAIFSNLLFLFFFRLYNFNHWMFWPSQWFLSTYIGPGCSPSNYISSWYSRHLFTSFSHPFLGLPNVLVAMGFHPYTSFTILSSGILYTCPNQPNLCNLMWFIMVFFISFFNSSFVIILHIPSLSLVGPKILLNIFLLNTNSFCFMDS